MTDPTSLDLLNDIVQPEAVNWWPPAPGWQILAVLLGLLLLLMAWRGWSKWNRNRYRRQALQELAAISAAGDATSFSQLPALLKRTALCAWPRALVASLSGPAWHEFLDRTAGRREFVGRAGPILDRLAYDSNATDPLFGPERELVLKAAENWIRRHQTDGRAG